MLPVKMLFVNFCTNVLVQPEFMSGRIAYNSQHSDTRTSATCPSGLIVYMGLEHYQIPAQAKKLSVHIQAANKIE